ncbi:MAG: PilW family protein, partial [Candidatus Binatia bacterium]
MTASKNRGFTLTELLVAMALSLTVLAGLYSFYVTHQRLYAIQAQLLETHQNLRIALEIIEEDIQGAGGTGIPPVAAVTL